MTRKLVPTPTECGRARGCVYSVATHRPGFCDACRLVQYEERKRRQRAVYQSDPEAKKAASRDAWRRAHPIEAMAEEKKRRAKLREIERQSRPPRVRTAAAPRPTKQKVVREIEAKVKPARARKQAPRPTTHAAILALWSNAHDNSPLRRKYPTKDALKRAGLQPGYRSERVLT